MQVKLNYFQHLLMWESINYYSAIKWFSANRRGDRPFHTSLLYMT